MPMRRRLPSAGVLVAINCPIFPIVGIEGDIVKARVQTKPRTIDVIVSLWGEHYTTLFLEYSLPSLLSPNNLPALTGRGRLLIITTPEDAERIAAHPAIAKAKEHVEVVCSRQKIESQDPFGQRYGIQAHLNKLGLAESLRAGNMSCVNAGDILFADGYLSALAKRADEGKRLVVGIGMRCALESTAPMLEELKQENVISIANRDLVGMGLVHMHPISHACMWDAPFFTRMPYLMQWSVFGQGVVVRGFGLHSMLIDTTAEVLSHKGNVDHDMARFFKREEIHYVTDSDEAIFTELALLTHFWPMATKYPASPEVVARWASDNICTPQWDHLQQLIRFHTDDIDAVRWAPVEARSNAIVSMINEASER
jgi:hypothetical protein